MAHLEQLIYAPKPAPALPPEAKKLSVNEQAQVQLVRIQEAYGPNPEQETAKEGIIIAFVFFWIIWFGGIAFAVTTWIVHWPEYRGVSVLFLVFFSAGLFPSVCGAVFASTRFIGHFLWPGKKCFDGAPPFASINERVESIWTNPDRQWQTDKFYAYRGEGFFPERFERADMGKELNALLANLADNDKFKELPEDEQVAVLVKRVLVLLIMARQTSLTKH